MNVNILLFDDFETLDAFGPIEVLGKIDDYILKHYSLNGGVNKSGKDTSIITEKVESISKEGILVIPGGKGSRTLVNDNLFLHKRNCRIVKLLLISLHWFCIISKYWTS